MKVLQINTVYDTGSTGRIMAGLYETQQECGIYPYVAFSRSDVPVNVNGYRIGNKADFCMHVAQDIFCDRCGLESKKETEKFLDWISYIKPDLIHIHNIHGFYIQIELLFSYIKEKNIPIVWTLHDCWPMTGHCASIEYFNCEKWKSGCGSCQHHIGTYPYSIIDNSCVNYQRKKMAFSGVRNLIIVTPSRWLANNVKQSFLSSYPVRIIPNGIDTEKFRIRSNKICAVNERKNIILGIANVWVKQKGLKYFEQLSKKIDDSFIIYLVGVNRSQQYILRKKYSGKIKGIKHTDSIDELVDLYNRSLCYVNLTLEDNFPTTNLEAQACGTPVVTFRTGGSPESINEGESGYVVEKGDIDKVYECICEISKRGKRAYSEKCEKKAAEYSQKKQFREYIELYKELMQKRGLTLNEE